MFNKGDKVKCISTGTVRQSSPDGLTKNKVYEVASNQTEDENVNVINDKGNSQGYFPERFEAYEEPAVVPVLDLSKPLETQDGQAVTLAVTDARGEYKLRGYLGDSYDLLGWTEEGKYYTGKLAHTYDLRNVAPKPLEREVYVNVYKGDDGELFSGQYNPSRASADENASSRRVACIKVKPVEGQYDE